MTASHRAPHTFRCLFIPRLINYTAYKCVCNFHEHLYLAYVFQEMSRFQTTCSLCNHHAKSRDDDDGPKKNETGTPVSICLAALPIVIMKLITLWVIDDHNMACTHFITSCVSVESMSMVRATKTVFISIMRSKIVKRIEKKNNLQLTENTLSFH